MSTFYQSKTKFYKTARQIKEDTLERMLRVRKSYQEKEFKQSQQNMNTHFYLIYPGNASYLVKNCMEHRINWQEPFSKVTSMYNFRWQQLSCGIDYNSLGRKGCKQIVNHFENHFSITNKANMFINLMDYCEKRKISVFKFVPFTIVYNFNFKDILNNENININDNVEEENKKREKAQMNALHKLINETQNNIKNYNAIGNYYQDSDFISDQKKRKDFELHQKKLKRKLIDRKNNGNIANSTNIAVVTGNKVEEDPENLLVINNKKNVNIDKINEKYLDRHESKYLVYSDLFPYVTEIDKIPKMIKDKEGNFVKEALITKEHEKKKKKRKEAEKIVGNSTLIEIPETHYKGKNMWVVKAINLNRGMCIRVVNNFEQLEKIIEKFKEGVDYDFTEQNLENELKNKTQNKNENNNNKEEEKNENKEEKEKEENKVKDKESLYYCRRIIVQKYIENPLLYKGRKCDMRIWVLLTQNMKAYVFKEGHLKTCSIEYDLNSKNAYTHITNYSFQKHNQNFQKYEEGNEVPFYDFQKFIDEAYPEKKYNLKTDLMKQVKKIITLTMLSIKNKINKNDRGNQFEIFGYDFMLDNDFNLFLIEINTNPGLEESSPWIKVIVPRMLDDALRMTIDQVFEPIYDFSSIIDEHYYNYNDKDKEKEKEKNETNNKNEEKEKNSEQKNNETKNNETKNKNENKKNNLKYYSPFPVPGYKPDENLWDFVCDLNNLDPNDKDLEDNIEENNKDFMMTFNGIRHLIYSKKPVTSKLGKSSNTRYKVFLGDNDKFNKESKIKKPKRLMTTKKGKK